MEQEKGAGSVVFVFLFFFATLVSTCLLIWQNVKEFTR